MSSLDKNLEITALSSRAGNVHDMKSENYFHSFYQVINHNKLKNTYSSSKLLSKDISIEVAVKFL